MSFRIVSIGNKARVSVSQKQLVIEQEEKVSIPVEDISVVVLDSYALSITQQVLTELSLSKVTVIVCDEKHLPVSLLLPFEQHSRQLSVHKIQLGLTLPFQKRLWQKIITQKIENQGGVLDYLHKEHSLHSISKTVQSGDTTGREAYAAQLYFKSIFDGEGTRRTPSKINSAFNYGYAILRAVIARNLASYGFLTALGIHHQSDLNQYNLADDFIESFRPVVDHYVLKEISGEGEDLSKEERAQILDILNKHVSIDNAEHTVKNAIEMSIKSFSSCCTTLDSAKLLLPKLRINDEIYENDGDV